MNPKTQYNQKEDDPRNQRRDLKRDNIQTPEGKMSHDMSLKMESEQIHKKSKVTSPKRNIKKVWRPKIGGFNSHVKTCDSYEEESIEEDTHSINTDHTIVEGNQNNEEELEMTLLLC